MPINMGRGELGYWMLPKPDTKVKRWERIPRLITHYVPFGYEVDPEDDRWLNPIPKELDALELAKKHLQQYTLTDVSAWLTKQTGRRISPAGLKKRVEIDDRRKSLAQIKRKLAKWLEETIAQYETLEKERLGAYTEVHYEELYGRDAD